MFLLLLDCIIKDDDHCLQASYGYGFNLFYGKGNSKITCESRKKHCERNQEDMKRCCPVTCQTGALSKMDCDYLDPSGSGTYGGKCIYPNEAQCYYKRGFEKIIIELILRSIF